MLKKSLKWLTTRMLIVAMLFVFARCTLALESRALESGAQDNETGQSLQNLFNPTNRAVAQALPAGPAHTDSLAASLRTTATSTPTPLPTPTPAYLREAAIPPTPRPAADVVDVNFGYDWVTLQHNEGTLLHPDGWWVKVEPEEVYLSSTDYSLFVGWEDVETTISWLFTESDQRSTLVQEVVTDLEDYMLAGLNAAGPIELFRFDQPILGGLRTAGASVYEFKYDDDWADGDIVYGGMAMVLCAPQRICWVLFDKIDEEFTTADWELLDYFTANLAFAGSSYSATTRGERNSVASDAAATPRQRVNPPAPAGVTTRPAVPVTGAIHWSQAQNFIGEKITVCGDVAGTRYVADTRGGPTFLNIGNDYPNPERVQAVIWERQRRAFSRAPQDLYRGQTICVDGTLQLYEGVPEIEVSSPSQIEVMEE